MKVINWFMINCNDIIHRVMIMIYIIIMKIREDNINFAIGNHEYVP